MRLRAICQAVFCIAFPPHPQTVLPPSRGQGRQGRWMEVRVPSDKVSGDAALADFLGRMIAERGAAANTLDAYGRDLSGFLAFVADEGLALDGIAPKHISTYMQRLAAEGLAPASRARKLSAIRQFFRFLDCR